MHPSGRSLPVKDEPDGPTAGIIAPAPLLLALSMLPVLFHLALFGRVVEIHTFGVLVALGCAAGTVLALREAHARGVEVALVRDLCLWGLAASLLGARLFDLVTGGRTAWDDCLDAASVAGGLPAVQACLRPLLPWEGGLAFYGGVAAGLLTVWRFTARHGMPLGATLDLLTPSLPLGHAFGRLGCLMAGCCWGRPASVPWAISFADGSAAFQEMARAAMLPPGALATPALHPTQLYELVAELVLLLVVLSLRRRTRFEGQLALIWLLGYASARLVIEVFRGDPSRGFLLELRWPALAGWLGLSPDAPLLLSTSQAIALGVLAAGLVLWRAGGQRHARLALAAATPVAAPAPAPLPRG